MKILKAEMKLMGITIKELSTEMGVTVGTVSNWIHGNNEPTPRHTKRLRGLGFSDAACLEPSKDVEV